MLDDRRERESAVVESVKGTKLSSRVPTGRLDMLCNGRVTRRGTHFGLSLFDPPAILLACIYPGGGK
jgi:hypothetical protein